MGSVKMFVKDILKTLGCQCLRSNSLPIGFDMPSDLNKYLRGDVRTVIDVGANKGQTAIWFAKEFPEANIYSVEPVPGSYQELVRVTRNRKNIVPVNVAIGEKEGTAVMVLLGDDSGMNYVSGSRGAQTENTLTVRMEALDDFMAARNISSTVDLLKIDVEGYEMNVLQGAKKSLEKGLINAIYIECTFYPHDTIHTQYDLIKAALHQYEFLFYAIYDVQHYDNRFDYCNALFVRPLDTIGV